MHPSPDVLALLALGEDAGTPAEREHVTSCAQCQAEIADLARAVVVGREGRTVEAGLVSPPDRVWDGIRAELGFGGTPESEDMAYGAHGLPEIATRTAQPRRAGVESNGSGPYEDIPEETPEPEPARTPDPEPARTPVPEPVHTLEPEPVRTPEAAQPAARPADVIDFDEARARRSSRARRLRAVAVAAALALVIGVGFGFGLDRLLDRQTVLWTADLQAQPDFAGSSGKASVVEDAQGNRSLRVELDSPQPVEGSREVWLINRGISQTKPIGWINGNSGQWPLPADLDPAQFPVVDVSKEPPGDPDLAHSGTSIVRGTLDV